MIKKIFHISDVHNRLYTRHEEYRYIYKSLFEKIREYDTSNALIVLTGDIVHAKTDISPEQMLLTTELLRGCADICPTLLIPGNHDYNESNKNKLDALYPIVEAMKLPNLYYSKTSEVLIYGNVAISHLSIFDGKANWKLAPDIQSDIKIALYHGPVVGSKTSIGFGQFTGALPVEVFDGFDMVLLGDIHMYQTLGSKNNIAYASSLIQQDHGESVDGHGFIIWDIDTCTHEFIEIPNPYALHTIIVRNGEIVGDIPKLSQNSVVRLMASGTSVSDIKAISDKLVTEHGISSIQVNEERSTQWRSAATSEITESIFKSWDIESQLSLFKEYFQTTDINISDDTIERISRIHRDMFAKYSERSVSSGVTWKLLSCEITNMFSYGENVVIDFESMRGIVGLFAPNRSGKSNLLDSVLFILFDKCTRTTLASYVLNKDSAAFRGEMRIQLGDKVFTISRYGKRGTSGKVSVSVEFNMQGPDGDIISLNGKSRDDTNKNIRNYFGTYDDFLTTTLNTQADPRSIIDMTQKDRKDIMYKYIDIDLYGILSNASKEMSREYLSEVKILSARNYDKDIADMNSEIEFARKTLDETTVAIEEADSKINELSSEIESIHINDNIEIIDIDSVNLKLSECNKNILEYNSGKNTATINNTNYKMELDSLVALVDSIDINSIKNDRLKLGDKILEHNKLKSELDSVNAKISHIESVIDKLSVHKYNPNCEYCISNKFVADALVLKDELPTWISSRQNLLDKISQIDLHKCTINQGQLDTLITEYDSMVARRDNYITKLNAVTSFLENVDKLIATEEEKISLYKDKIDRYHINVDVIKINKLNAARKEELSTQRNELLKTKSELNQKLISCNVDIQLINSKIEKCILDRDRLLYVQSEYDVYEKYSVATSRNGVPFMILKNVIPIIESEVNDVLGISTNFKIQLEMVDLDINGYIMGGPDGNDKWPFELASGMEKFIISTAIRSSLVRISGLPKPNFLLVDEGFGVLDTDNLRGVINVLNHLKDKFGFILCVSHITELRDYVDTILNVSKIDGKSIVSQEAIVIMD